MPAHAGCNFVHPPAMAGISPQREPPPGGGCGGLRVARREMGVGGISLRTSFEIRLFIDLIKDTKTALQCNDTRTLHCVSHIRRG